MSSYNPPLSGRSAFSGTLLDFNERTLPPSSKVQKAIQTFLESNKLQLYPEYGELEEKLAQYVGVNNDQVIITNGSDQAIDLIFRAFTELRDTVIIPTPSFAMFTQSAQIVGNNVLCPLYEKEKLTFPLKKILEMINSSIKLIVICNPNNPTGTLVTVKAIEQIARKATNAIILVDEAYFEFSKVTAIPSIKKYPNIIVTRTLSKAFGLPSLRLGYIVASSTYIAELSKIRGPYDINMIACTAALASLDDLKSVQEYITEVMDQAKTMVEKFFTKNDITFYKSAANFLLYKPVREQEENILKENGILVRPQNKTGIENTLRLTIGTTEQMENFIAIYQRVILNKSRLNKIAFLDRDGTLIFEPQDTFQIDSVDKLKILDGVIKALKALVNQGYELVMITNQDGLGTPTFPQKNFDAAQNRMLSIFKQNKICFKQIYICPHLPSINCSCRKPKTGLVKDFLSDTQIDKTNSFVCGDRQTDKFFAKNIGLKFISIPTNGDFYNALRQGGVIV